MREEDKSVHESGFLWLILFLKFLRSVLSVLSTLRRLYVLDMKCMLLALVQSVVVSLR